MTRPGDDRWTKAEITRCVVAALAELVALAPDFGPSSDLHAVGLDSLAVTQLMLAIEESTGVWIDESLLTPENLATAETLAACIHEQLHGGSAGER
jgi:acyl carrier protein